MLKGIDKIISPDLLKIMMEMGHGDEIVISDGNFPAASIAQRLVRRICKHCKEPVEISEELRADLNLTPDMQFYHGKGCSKCDGSGYKGRCGIYEFLVPNEGVRNLILKRASGDEIKRTAIKECGLITLRMDGIQKALAGLTTLEQALSASTRDD